MLYMARAGGIFRQRDCVHMWVCVGRDDCFRVMILRIQLVPQVFFSAFITLALCSRIFRTPPAMT